MATSNIIQFFDQPIHKKYSKDSWQPYRLKSQEKSMSPPPPDTRHEPDRPTLVTKDKARKLVMLAKIINNGLI